MKHIENFKSYILNEMMIFQNPDEGNVVEDCVNFLREKYTDSSFVNTISEQKEYSLLTKNLIDDFDKILRRTGSSCFFLAKKYGMGANFSVETLYDISTTASWAINNAIVREEYLSIGRVGVCKLFLKKINEEKYFMGGKDKIEMELYLHYKEDETQKIQSYHWIDDKSYLSRYVPEFPGFARRFVPKEVKPVESTDEYDVIKIVNSFGVDMNTSLLRLKRPPKEFISRIGIAGIRDNGEMFFQLEPKKLQDILTDIFSELSIK